MSRHVWLGRCLTAGLSGLLLLLAWLVTPSDAVFAAPLTQEQEPVEHVVRAGETLFAIAQQYNTTVEAMVEANGIADPSMIAVGQTLIIPTGAGEGSPQEGSQGGEQHSPLNTYVIVPGDTLEAVARRFDTTAATLAELNGVLSPTGLPAGGRLRVPGENVGRLHRVAQDETALGLALRYDLPLWEFLAINDLGSSGALLPGQRVWVPGEVFTDGLPLPLEALDVGPVPILQGQTVRVRVDLVSEGDVRGIFDDQTLNFAVEGNAHYALFGLHALGDPGTYTLALLATDASGDEVYLTRPLQVLDGGYVTEEINLTVDLLDDAAMAVERERVAQIRPVFNPERYWDGLFTRPITTEVTSAFGTRRLYKYPSTQFYGYHEGTDFNGEVGSLVYAPAAGVVVLAEELYLRGNALVIDHGWGVYTGYWHLSQFDVQVGQRVEPGELIARVGSTGRSTGAHLHWDLWVNGTNVSALQWTEQLFP
jgi:murein DD-endopeptidase MepM/ murein hydrolase activator NlpD